MQTITSYVEQACLLIRERKEKHEIEKFLEAKGADEKTIAEVMDAAKKELIKKQINRGCIKVGAGILFLGAGFLCTFLFNHSGLNYHISLYGFTSIGIIFVFAGMIDMFG
jgi:hypothetical protein